MDVALLIVTPVAAAPPKSTAVAFKKLVPVKVTDVPAASGPLLRLSAVTVGAVA